MTDRIQLHATFPWVVVYSGLVRDGRRVETNGAKTFTWRAGSVDLFAHTKSAVQER